MFWEGIPAHTSLGFVNYVLRSIPKQDQPANTLKIPTSPTAFSGVPTTVGMVGCDAMHSGGFKTYGLCPCLPLAREEAMTWAKVSRKVDRLSNGGAKL